MRVSAVLGAVTVTSTGSRSLGTEAQGPASGLKETLTQKRMSFMWGGRGGLGLASVRDCRTVKQDCPSLTSSRGKKDS